MTPVRTTALDLIDQKEAHVAVYTITPDNPNVNALTIVAADTESIGNQVAAHFARNKRLVRSLPFHASVNEAAGEIRQQGLAKPLTFRIEKQGA